MTRVCAIVALTLGPASPVWAQTETPAATPDGLPGGCVLTGSPSVFANGVGMLRIGDVAGCPDVRYEIIPGVFINGQPAVRLLPDEDCAPGGSENVQIDGGQAGVAGSGC